MYAQSSLAAAKTQQPEETPPKAAPDAPGAQTHAPSLSSPAPAPTPTPHTHTHTPHPAPAGLPRPRPRPCLCPPTEPPTLPPRSAQPVYAVHVVVKSQVSEMHAARNMMLSVPHSSVCCSGTLSCPVSIHRR